MTVEQAPPDYSNFTANFEIIITGIRTATVGDLTNVIKQVEWTMKGTENGQTFELPQKTELGDPQAETFIPLESITDPAVIVAWVQETDTRIAAIKGHIQSVLNKMIKEAESVATPLPWAPPPPTPAAPIVEPTP